jgi:UDP-N-acetyl-D-mannosaminuronic acid dehydrogenase
MPDLQQTKEELKTHDLPPALNKKICILGLGYIGLPTAIIAASHGFNVVGIDVDEVRVQQIMAGDPVIQEPLVYEQLQLVLRSGHFRATMHLEPADYFIIAVPTPITKDKKADIHYVLDATLAVAPVLKKGNTVIVESTVPVGVTEHVAQLLAEKTGMSKGIDFFVVHCPERVLPGNIMHELIHNDRIIGGINEQSVETAKIFYKQFVRGCLYLTDAKTAEMVKLVENSSRDAQLAFAHQIASMADAAGLSPYQVIELANKHPRVNILRPTCGVGGHCIAVDPWFLVDSFPHHSSFIKAARETNDAKPVEVIACIKKAVEGWHKKHHKNPTTLLLGLTYKPDVDDLRESPALQIAKTLQSYNKTDLLIHEPYVKANILKPLFGDRLISSIVEGISQADIVIFLVAHQRFSIIDKTILKSKKVLDFCGVLYQPKFKVTNNEISFWPTKSMIHFVESSLIEHEQRERSEEISS